MNKKRLKDLKEKLEKEKVQIEKELETFAKRDKKLEGDWNTRFPHHDDSSGSSALESAADEVEEYTRLLPIEYNLELRLKNINLALKKIKEGKYGVCENCKKQITLERLKIYPEARTCLKCKNQK